MKKLIISFSIALFASGCSFPDEPALRIAISVSPGSTVFYLAQELELFKQHGVKVQLVELDSGCDCGISIADEQVDAAVMPFVDLALVERLASATGILMLMSVQHNYIGLHDHERNTDDHYWEANDLEILVGNREAIMRRRNEWQRILQAYEHARMLLVENPEQLCAMVAKRERRSAEKLLGDLRNWTIFSITQQDSLLGKSGPYENLAANWHGRSFLTSSSPLAYSTNRSKEVVSRVGQK